MWRRKKFILIALLAAVVLAGSTVGVVFAQSENNADEQPKTLLSRVAEILQIDEQALKDAFIQAQKEMQTEAVERYLEKAVEQGAMTQEEANQYLEWWRARPDIPLPGPLGQCFKALVSQDGLGHRFGGGPGPLP